MRYIATLAFVFSFLCTQAQLKFTFVNPQTDQIRIKNFGTSTVDISTYRLCALFEYITLNQAGISIVSGSFNLAPGAEVLFTWNASIGFGPTSSDLGLYLPSGAFSSASAMVDFFQYGNSGQGREGVANSAGLWNAGTFLTGTGPWYYIGNGTASGFAQWSNQLPVTYPYVVINELDSDQVGTDNAEFVELFGDPNAALDGLVVVFFNGADDKSYAAFDLDGYSLNNQGFFVLGNVAVPNVSLVFPNNTLQNGADAVAIYIGNGSDWPNGTNVSSNNLKDAIVYGTADPIDMGLINALTPGQIQADEGNTTTAVTVSLSRVPNGGLPFQTNLFITQAPTPGVSNTPDCGGGTVNVGGSQAAIDLCSSASNQIIEASNAAIIGSNYIFILTNGSNEIIGTSETGSFDLTAQALGNYRIWGLSYTGNLNQPTLQAGQPLAGVTSSACFSLSSNHVAINKINCSVAFCNGGTIQTSEGLTYISLCADNLVDNYSFTTTSNATGAQYQYLITTPSLAIVAFISGSSFDFNTLAVGDYLVHGISYIGTLNPATTAVGSPAAGITAMDDECVALSFNSIVVKVLSCTLGEGCTQLYFSEYIEGLGNNKAFEIYNPTPFPVDLSQYQVLRYTNGASNPSPIIILSGTLQPGDVYVVANSQANATILAQADVTGGIATFNGNDALVLTHNSIPIDIIGIIGNDPGVAWTFGNGSTADKVLVRKPQINAPTMNWDLCAGQWLVYPPDNFTFIGSHNALPCGATAFVGFSTAAQLVPENVGQVSVTVNAFNVSDPFTISITTGNSTATAGLDYIDIFPLSLSFDENTTSHTFNITIIDDEVEEYLYEFITLVITVTQGQAVAQVANQTITIEPSDRSYPLYPIGLITTNDLNGMPDSLGVFCSIKGVVHGINFNPTGTQFTLIDQTGGIKVFDATENFGYTVAEGDSVMVQGQVSNFLGMNEFYPDFIYYISSGHPLEQPVVVTTLGEQHESRMVRINCVKLVNPAQWTNAQNGFDVTLTDGVNTFTMRVDMDTDIYGTPAPQGHFNVIGIGAQLDVDGLPYDTGYQFWPRYLDDYFDHVVASFTPFSELQFGDAGASVNFQNTSLGANTYSWNFGDGADSDQASPSHAYSYAFLSANPFFTISLAATNSEGCTDVFTQSVDGVYVGVEEYAKGSLSVYPVPARDELFVSSQNKITRISLHDSFGRLLMTNESLQSNLERINTTTYAPGHYLLSVETDQHRFVQQIIIGH